MLKERPRLFLCGHTHKKNDIMMVIARVISIYGFEYFDI